VLSVTASVPRSRDADSRPPQMTVITRNGAIVLEFDDKENCPLDELLAAKLGTPPLELENLEDRAKILAAVKSTEKEQKLNHLEKMRDDKALFAKNVFTLATLFCDYMPPANTARGKMTATAMYLSGRLAKIQKAGLDGLKAMFPGAPDDFYKDALTLAGEKHEMLEARVDKLEARQDKLEARQDKHEVQLENVPSRKSFEAHNEKLVALNEKVVAHAETLEELKEMNKALKEELKEKDKALKEELKEKDKALKEELEEKDKAVNEKLVAHAKELEELKEMNKALKEELNEKIEALVELVGEMRANIMKHFKFFREVSKSELEEKDKKDKALIEKLEEMMQNITNDLDKRIAGVSKASIKRDNEIKLAIAATASAAAAKPGAAQEQEWIEHL